MNPHTALEELTNCAICLDKFTNPKALPCQHTYCLNCLRGIAQNEHTLTCPHCREVHVVPSNGVKGFKDNLVVKNLLELNFKADPIPNHEVACFDCGKAVVLSKCEHCLEKVCVDCRVTHNRLSWEIDTILVGLQDLAEKQKDNRENWQNRKAEFDVELQKLQAVFQKLRAKLEQRQQQLCNAMAPFDLANQIFSGEFHLPRTKVEIAEKFHLGKDAQSLEELKSTVKKLKSVMTIMSEKEANVKFVSGDDERFGNNIGVFGALKLGENLINLVDEDHGPTAFLRLRTRPDSPMNYQPSSSEHRQDRMEEEAPQSSTSQQPDTEPASGNVRALFPLPTGVDYASKNVHKANHCILTIGPYCTIQGQDPFLVSNPNSAHYNPYDKRIYVCCTESNRIASFDTSGFKAKLVFITKQPTSMIVADDGNVYIAEAQGRIRRGDCAGSFSGLLEEQNEDVRVDLLAHYDNKLLALDSQTKVLYILNLDGQVLRSFTIHANVVLAMTADKMGRIFLATEDRGQCFILVYSLHGVALMTVNASTKELGDIGGILVDGDDYLCVSRPNAGRVDVYNPNHQFVRSLSGTGVGALSTPTALSWLPNGRILVCDSEKNRVVIL